MQVENILLLLLVAALGHCQKQVEKEHVVVIGGGIAGLAAAREILNRGFENFTVQVFEARRERYGGRVWTDKLNNPKARGFEVDLGGSALSIANPFLNPLLNLTTNLELETAVISGVQFTVPWQKKHFAGSELIQAMTEAGSILTDAINITRQKKEDISIKEAVDRQLQEQGYDSDNIKSLLLRSFPSYVISDYSALYYQPDSLDFGYEKVLLDGMGELVDRLVSGADDERPLKINLKTPVRQVKVDSSKNKILLRLKDGSQVTADHVIVAVPASVIAKGILLFEPLLPEEYQFATKEMGMADGNKIIVEFESAFWSNEFGVFLLATKNEEERGFLQTWLNVHKVLGKPVLVGLLFGEKARDFEKIPDDKVQALVVKKLGQVFGMETVAASPIKQIIRSTWSSDQWSGGASSYPRVGNSPKLWDALSQPLCPHKVYFAGEHTVFRGHGTLHGAYTSGLRAAEQVLSGYCPQKAFEDKQPRQEVKKKAKKVKKEKEEKVKGSIKQQTDDTKNDEL